MMRVLELLEKLREQNVRIWIEDDQLKYGKDLPSDLQHSFEEHKDKIWNLLKNTSQRNYTSNISNISPQDRTNPIPLSFAQHRLWFMEQLQPESSFYNIQDIRLIKGPLNLNALKKSLLEIIRRHEILRTTFEEKNGQPMQIISSQPHFMYSFLEWTSLPKEKQKAAIEQFIKKDFDQPFDFTTALFRTNVIQLDQEEHILILSMHHIISDGWSMGIFFAELNSIYSAFIHDLPSPLEDLNIQYADYSIWQRKQLQEKNIEKEFDYWKKKLQDAPYLIELPSDLPRPAIQKYKGKSFEIRIPQREAEQLEKICTHNQATLFMGIFTLYNILLQRYTYQDDIIVGTVTANRSNVEIENLIGFFVNTLPIRTHFSKNMNFIDLLQQIRDSCLEAYIHQHIPFEMLVEHLNPKRDLSYTPFIQAICVLQNNINDKNVLLLNDLQVETIEGDYDTVKFDLSLSVVREDEQLICYFGYNTELFTEQRIQQVAESFRYLFTDAIQSPFENISKLSILSQENKNEWISKGQAKKHMQLYSTIHEKFEQQVRLYPKEIAVSYEQEKLTYEQLNMKANQLASWLIEHGVTRSSRVSICLDRSLEIIISIIAVLKTGAAYIPIDPYYPKERKHYILKDSDSEVLITESTWSEDFEKTNSLFILFLDEAREYLQYQSDHNPEILCDPSDLAYIIYTSGTTGKPKGVMIPHSNVVRLFDSTDRIFEFQSKDKWCLFHSFAFDFSVWEMWGALFYGGELIIIPYWISRSIDEFYQYIHAKQVTILNQTPSAFYQFIESDRILNLTLSLRVIVFGGEALELSKLNLWLEKYSDYHPILINMYGITETTVHVTYRQIKKLDLMNDSMIGQKIDDLELYILDEYLQPVPEGVIGEIHIGGAGLAIGYNHLPELTDEKFISHPFASQKNARLYRTGDLARFRKDDIEYIGRKDEQVKIRGYRIELEEIQKNINSYPDIHQALVVVRKNEAAESEILAYYVTLDHKVVHAEDLRNYLKKHLPAYMIPSWFIPVEQFSLTSNGKVDRKHLPHPKMINSFSNKQIVAPKNDLERKMLEIWKNILNISVISTEHNFFELGGHSFTSIQLIRQIEKVVGYSVPVSVIFQNPTISSLVEALENNIPQIQSSTLIELRKSSNSNSIAFVHPIGGDIFCYANLVQLLHTDQSIYGCKAPGLDNEEPVLSSIHKMAKRYKDDLNAIQKSPEIIVGWSMGGIIGFEIGMQLFEEFGKAPLLIMIDSWSENIMSELMSEQEIVQQFIMDFLKSINASTSLITKKIQSLSELYQLLQESKNEKNIIEMSQIETYFNIYKANLIALHQYNPQQKYPGQIVLLSASELQSNDDTHGWKIWSEKEIDVKTIVGDHYTVLQPPGIHQIADHINKLIADIDSVESSGYV